jgi:Xaa-Pro aminopeptidase
VQATKSRWGAGRAAHDAAVRVLVAEKDRAFAEIARRVRAGEKVTEGDIAVRIRDGMKAAGLVAEWPIVAAGENGANPHYAPAETGSREIRRGDVVVIDMASRKDGDPAAICADMTFVGYVGETVPKDVADVFAVVARARDATVAFLGERFRAGTATYGWEADGVARGVVTKAGYGAEFIHRTGHSIDTRVHGDGANLDDFETHDTRPFIPDTGFSVEPGIYLPGKFGIRSEIDCHTDGKSIEVTTPRQTEVTPILSLP